MEATRVKTKAVEKLMMINSTSPRRKSAYMSNRTLILKGIIPIVKATNEVKRPKTIAKSVQLPMGLPIFPKKFPSARMSLPLKILIAENSAMIESDRKRATSAWSIREMLVKTTLLITKTTEPKSM